MISCNRNKKLLNAAMNCVKTRKQTRKIKYARKKNDKYENREKRTINNKS